MDINNIQLRIIERRAQRSQRPINQQHPIWNSFNDDHYHMFQELLENPLTFNPADHPNVLHHTNVVLTPAIGDDLPENQDVIQTTDVPEYYLRCANFTVPAIGDILNLYELSHSYDIDWINHVRGQLNDLANVPLITIIYAGFTHRSTPNMRLVHDISHRSASRFRNFYEVANNPQWQVYQVLNLTNITEDMSLVEAGYIEDILIKSCGPTALNSANGGFYIDWHPNQDLLNLWTTVAEQINYSQFFVLNRLSYQREQVIIQHFNDQANFIRQQSTQRVINAPTPNNILVNTAIRQGTPQNVLNNQTVSVMVGKDITQRAFAIAAHTFWEDASVSPHFLQEIYQLLYSNAPNTQERHFTYPTFVDLFSLSPQQQFLISMPYLCRYIKVTKPIIIITLSHQVFSMFDIDLFKTAWKSRDVRSRFLEQTTSPNNFTRFGDFIRTGYPTTAFEETYREYIGEVSIVMYGPDDTDLALMIPMRHPGSLRHDPALAHYKAEEIFLVACCSNVLDMIVRRRLHNGEVRPNEHGALLQWLQDIRNEYNRIVTDNDLHRRLNNIKNMLQTRESTILALRIADARTRNNLNEQRIVQRQYGPQTSRSEPLRFLGEINGTIRANQLQQLRAIYQDRQARGRVNRIVPCPLQIENPVEAVYRTWFMNARPGTIIYRVANATGNNPMTNLTEEERDEYLRRRSMGRYGASANRQVNEIQRTDNILRILMDPTQWNDQVPDSGFKIAHCMFCDHRFFKFHNVPHICPELDDTPMNAQSDGLNYTLVFYAHDALELLSDDDVDLMEVEEFDAATEINNAANRVVHYEAGSLGVVYCIGRTDTTQDFVRMMAVDKEIIYNTEGRIDLVERDDEFVIQTQQTRNALINYFSTPNLRQYPLCETRCGVNDLNDRCNYYSIRIPARSGSSRNRRPILRNEQHKHGLLRRQARCTFGEYLTEFNRLPMSVQRFLWFAYCRRLLTYDPRDWQVDPVMYRPN
ncbi:hypothetical protein BDC45DRAFT_571105 [Circinella umbellata]|nr:hypothetical protein BDC45DRAFT_571105 [Circinella umbellata]